MKTSLLLLTCLNISVFAEFWPDRTIFVDPDHEVGTILVCRIQRLDLMRSNYYEALMTGYWVSEGQR